MVDRGTGGGGNAARAAYMPPLQNSVNGRFVGDAYMRPVGVAAAARLHGAVKTAPYKAPVHAIL